MLKFIGAIFVLAGLLYSVWIALRQRKLSQPPRSPDNQNSVSLEPKKQGMRFLGLTQNFPAISLVVIGAALLLLSE